MDKSSLFLTPAQIAEELQVSILTVYSYIRTNELVALRLGRTYRIHRYDFDEFIRRHKNR